MDSKVSKLSAQALIFFSYQNVQTSKGCRRQGEMIYYFVSECKLVHQIWSQYHGNTIVLKCRPQSTGIQLTDMTESNVVSPMFQIQYMLCLRTVTTLLTPCMLHDTVQNLSSIILRVQFQFHPAAW